MRTKSIFGLGTILTAAASLGAQAPATSPADAALTQPAATAPAADQGAPLKIVVTGVEGLVQVRTAEDQPWQKATVGMELTQGAEFRTGPKSAVRFVIPPDQTITLDRLGTVKVLQAIQQSGRKIKTDLGMKYGRTRYDIEAAGNTHEAQIHSPSATLAIRGTSTALNDQAPFVPYATITNGRARFKNLRGQFLTFSNQSTIQGNQNGSAEEGLNNSTLDTGSRGARTQQEQTLVQLFQLFNGADLAGSGSLGNLGAGIGGSGGNNNGGTGGGDGGSGGGVFADVTTSTNPFTIRIFDNALEDGDRVRVYFNNSVIANDLTLTSAGQNFILNLAIGNNTLTLENLFTPEGNGELNTGSVDMPAVGGTTYDFSMNSLGETRTANIHYESGGLIGDGGSTGSTGETGTGGFYLTTDSTSSMTTTNVASTDKPTRPRGAHLSRTSAIQRIKNRRH